MTRKTFVLFLAFALASLSLAACEARPGSATPIPSMTASPLPPTSTETFLPTRAPDVSLAEYDGSTLSVPTKECKQQPKEGEYAGLIQSIAATDELTVTFTLCRPDPDFLFRVSFSPFGIYPSEWIKATDGAANRTSDGLQRPVGTGPYMLQEWKHGESLTLGINPDYWGDATGAKMLVFLWSADAATRLADLQAGIVDGIDNVPADDFETVRADSLLALFERPAPSGTASGLLDSIPALAKFVAARPAVAYRADVTEPQASPFGIESFHLSAPDSRDSFVWMQAAEPLSLFCADESDVDTLRACAQILEPLYRFDANSAVPIPALAESCEPNEEKTVWTCRLREGVQFHDGSTFDATDVVATFNMGLNTGSPSHVGRANQWEFFDAFWGLMKRTSH